MRDPKKVKNIVKWKTGERPSGRYASFYKQEWPTASYKDKGQTVCATVVCEDDYIPSNVKVGNHRPLTLRIVNHSVKPWKWVTVKKTYLTLKDAKAGLLRVLEKYPHLIPSHLIKPSYKKE